MPNRTVCRHLTSLALVAGCLLAVAPAHAALPAGFSDQGFATGLSQPASCAFLPDGRLLVIEQRTGDVHLVVGGVVAPAALTVADINTSGGERGLLGVAVDPGWPARPYLYLYFDRSPGNTIYISRFTGSGDLSDPGSSTLSFASRYDIITDIPDDASNHNAGTLRFGPDDMLYASVGDDADQCDAQDSTLFKGVVLRMDVSGLPAGAGGPPTKASITPGNNPFPPTNANAGLTYCFGLRNPFRMSIDPLTCDVFVGDVGQSSYEELDRVQGGENFGWPFREGPGLRTPGGCSEPGGAGSQSYDAPIAYYDRSQINPASIICGPAYRLIESPGGAYAFPPAYDGAVFFSEYYAGFLRAVHEVGGVWSPLDPVPGQPNGTDWGTGYGGISDWVQGADGAIYYVKQFPGEIRRIAYTGATLGLPGEGVSARLVAAPNPLRATRPELTVRFDNPSPGSIRLEAIDVRGRRIVDRDLGSRPAGPVEIRLDLRGASGAAPAPGVLFFRLRGDGWARTGRVTLLP